ncbi:hypothetical protein CRENBAI_020664 [Crenichthys baileyi]|uniref:Uncharacterized protein n=1 Tax=Crenichthys baileyi TaxID=28760 RepID=A0AAV9RTS9_9TELE
MSLCNYTPQKTFIPLLFTERDERQERQRHVIAPLTERGGEEVRDTKNKGTKGCSQFVCESDSCEPSEELQTTHLSRNLPARLSASPQAPSRNIKRRTRGVHMYAQCAPLSREVYVSFPCFRHTSCSVCALQRKETDHTSHDPPPSGYHIHLHTGMTEPPYGSPLLPFLDNPDTSPHS